MLLRSRPCRAPCGLLLRIRMLTYLSLHLELSKNAKNLLKGCRGTMWIFTSFTPGRLHLIYRNEWYEAMMKLKEQGKIRAIGVSVPDTTPDDVIGALALGKVDSVQVIYNIFEQYPEWNLLPAADKFGTGIIVRVPFDESALTGKLTVDTTFQEGDVRKHYFRGNNLKSVVKRVKEIEQFKNRRHPEMPMAEYALRFCLSNNTVSTVIPGIRNVRQAELNTSVSDGNFLPQDELAELKQFYWKKDFWHEEVEL